MKEDVTASVSTNQGNPIKLEWADISKETFRTYVFPTGRVTIDNPVKLNVKRKPEGDSHRIVDKDGLSYYVPAGWLLIIWGGQTYTF